MNQLLCMAKWEARFGAVKMARTLTDEHCCKLEANPEDLLIPVGPRSSDIRPARQAPHAEGTFAPLRLHLVLQQSPSPERWLYRYIIVTSSYFLNSMKKGRNRKLQLSVCNQQGGGGGEYHLPQTVRATLPLIICICMQMRHGE